MVKSNGWHHSPFVFLDRDMRAGTARVQAPKSINSQEGATCGVKHLLKQRAVCWPQCTQRWDERPVAVRWLKPLGRGLGTPPRRLVKRQAPFTTWYLRRHLLQLESCLLHNCPGKNLWGCSVEQLTISGGRCVQAWPRCRY